MANKALFPDYIFESSWEVCNKVGGIYAVLSTRARTLHDRLGDHLIFIGPDCWKSNPCPYFKEDKSLFKEWKLKAASEGLSVKVGRWTIPVNLLRSLLILIVIIRKRMRSMASFGRISRSTAFMLMEIMMKRRCSPMRQR